MRTMSDAKRDEINAKGMVEMCTVNNEECKWNMRARDKKGGQWEKINK